jgi:hypothetical protein
MPDPRAREAIRALLRQRSQPNPFLDAKTKRFLEAVKAGELAKVTAMLDADPSLAVASDRGESAFLLAIRHGRRQVRDLLLARGVEPDLFESLADGQLRARQSPSRARSSTELRLMIGKKFRVH